MKVEAFHTSRYILPVEHKIHLANKTALSRIGLMTSFKETLPNEIKLLVEEERSTLGSQRTMGRYWVHPRTRVKRLDKKVQNV